MNVDDPGGTSLFLSKGGGFRPSQDTENFIVGLSPTCPHETIKCSPGKIVRGTLSWGA